MKLLQKLLVLGLILSLSGCMKFRGHYAIDREGKVSGSYDLLVLSTLMEGHTDEIEIPANATIITDGDYQGYNIPLDANQQAYMAEYITIANNKLTFKMPLSDLNNLPLANYSQLIKASNLDFWLADDQMKEAIELKVDFAVDGKILENNATSIVDGKLCYDLIKFQEDEIYFVYDLGMDSKLICLLAAIGSVVFVGLVIWITSYLRKKNKG
ncbi:MAG: hypothetical protein SPH32_04960 [Erysipelotrichaceae bacterium]|nr:hypothetical protein [Erysipelotrichaceae bacterium]